MCNDCQGEPITVNPVTFVEICKGERANDGNAYKVVAIVGNTATLEDSVGGGSVTFDKPCGDLRKI